MKFFAAKNTKNIIHVGKSGNKYQLDCVLTQLLLEERIAKHGQKIEYVSADNREDEALKLVDLAHDKNYLDVFIQKSDSPTFLTNGFLLQPSLYQVALEQALIAKDMVESAQKNGISFSTIGGGHHCESDTPLGFGLVNTMAISALYATSKNEKVALLDLDTHYSNGCNEILVGQKNILMCSLWNQVIPYWKYMESKDNLVHQKAENAEDYLEKLDNILGKIQDYKPTLFIYHMGFDVLESDRMGGISGMTEKKLIERETIMKKFMDGLKIPTVIYRGGGYIKYTSDDEENKRRQEYLLDVQMSVLEDIL